MEIKDIPGYEGLYRISEDGRVFKTDGREMKGNYNSYGYRVVRLTKDKKPKDHKVHRLVAIAFIPNPNNYECVNHIDGDKTNNSIPNLERCTRGYNNRHARSVLNIDFSPKPVVQKDLDGNVIAMWRSADAAATIIGATSALIGACCKGTADSANGYIWEYAGEEFYDFVKLNRIQVINSQIEQLQQELQQLS